MLYSHHIYAEDLGRAQASFLTVKFSLCEPCVPWVVDSVGFLEVSLSPWTPAIGSFPQLIQTVNLKKGKRCALCFPGEWYTSLLGLSGFHKVHQFYSVSLYWDKRCDDVHACFLFKACENLEVSFTKSPVYLSMAFRRAGGPTFPSTGDVDLDCQRTGCTLLLQ